MLSLPTIAGPPAAISLHSENMTRSFIWLGLFVGTSVGGYLPLLWGGDVLSLSSIVLSGLGGIVGIYLGWRYQNS